MNVSPGDLAVIVKGRPENIGRIVRVLRAYGDVDYSEAGFGVLPCWDVASLGGMLDTSVGPSMTGHTPDITLCRLDGLTPQQQFDEAMAEFGELLREMYGDGTEGEEGA